MTQDNLTACFFGCNHSKSVFKMWYYRHSKMINPLSFIHIKHLIRGSPGKVSRDCDRKVNLFEAL